MTRELIGQGALDAFDVYAPAAFQASPPSCSRSIDPFIRLAYFAGVESGGLSRGVEVVELAGDHSSEALICCAVQAEIGCSVTLK
jgi:hypothetical protein